MDGHRIRKKVKRGAQPGPVRQEHEDGAEEEELDDDEEDEEEGREQQAQGPGEQEEEEPPEVLNDPSRFKYYSVSEALFLPPRYDE